MIRSGPGRARERLLGALALAALAAAVWFGLGMNRGLLLSSDVKSRCWPWAPAYPPTTLQAPVLTDPVWQFVPWLEFARGELLAGRLPLWNPHQDGGVPLLGNAQAAVASPLAIPAIVLGIAVGWNVTLLLKILVAATGTFLWLRDLGRSRAASALGAVMFSLSGPFVAWLEHPQTLAAAPVPFLLLFAGRLARRGTPCDLLGTALASAAVLCGGHPETAAMAALLTGAFVLASAPRASGIGRAAVGGVLGSLMAAPAILPFAEYFALSAARFGADRQPFTLPLADLGRFVAPHAPIGHPIEAAATVSLIGGSLAVVGAINARRRTRIAVALVASAVILTLAYRNPVAEAVARHTLVYWSRGLLLLPLPLGLLAAAGLDTLRARLRAAGAARWSALGGRVAVVVAAAELMRAASGVHAVTPASEVSLSAPVLDRLAADHEPFRVLPLHTFLPPNSATACGLDDIRGYDALTPLAWRRQREAIGRFTSTGYVSDVLEPWNLAPGGAALDAWNVKYLLLHPQLAYDAERLNREVGLDLEEVYLGPDGRLLRNRRVLPRVRLLGPGSVRVLERTPLTWRLAVAAAEPATLLLADPWYPGWQAQVDGRPAALAGPVGAPIQVAVPGGRHSVVIRYRPRSFAVGLALAAAGVIAFAALSRAWGKRSPQAG